MPTEFRRETYSFSSGKTYTFRSGWESNWAFYLDWLKEKGEIYAWEYETERYYFIKTEGNRQIALGNGYLPDFKVWDTPVIWHLEEIKGREQGIVKLKRMKKFYPDIKIILIDRNCYMDVKRKVGKMLNFS